MLGGKRQQINRWRYIPLSCYNMPMSRKLQLKILREISRVNADLEQKRNEVKWWRTDLNLGEELTRLENQRDILYSILKGMKK